MSELTTTLHDLIDAVGLAIDVAGVLVILTGVVIATFRFAAARPRGEARYAQFRLDLGRGILLGLEFLVAADIIRTVAATPTLNNVLVLGLIVLIRTFLSIALQVELEGRWPWQHARARPPRAAADSKL